MMNEIKEMAKTWGLDETVLVEMTTYVTNKVNEFGVENFKSQPTGIQMLFINKAVENYFEHSMKFLQDILDNKDGLKDQLISELEKRA